MNIDDIIMSELSSKSIVIHNLLEGIVPLNPTLAYLTLKRNNLKKMHKAPDSIDKIISNELHKIKTKALISKEKLRSEAGIKTGRGKDGTVYKFTKEQLEVLSEIHEKYGDEMIDRIQTFRKDVLAPYQLIKRLVKKNKTLTSKEIVGMTHSQFTAGLESGKKKIERRKEFFVNGESYQDKIESISIAIDNLKTIESEFLKTGKLNNLIIKKVMQHYDLGSGVFDMTLSDLRKTVVELKKNANEISDIDKNSELDSREVLDKVRAGIDLRKGVVRRDRLEKQKKRMDTYGKYKRDNTIDESTESDDEFDLTNRNQFAKGKNFNVALGKYLLRAHIIDELRNSIPRNVYKKTYESILEKLIDEAIKRRRNLIEKKSDTRTKIEFNEIERKIYKAKPTVKTKYSGDIDDYNIVIDNDDFTPTVHIKRPEELKEAEKKIEAAIKRFERSLQTILDEEDFKKLKKYRLINNLIVVSELKSPENLFLSKAEIAAKKTGAK